MDYDDLRETKIVPSVSFKTVSLSSRETFSTTLSEQESKRNSYSPFKNGKGNEDTRKAERSKIESTDHPKSNRDDLRRADYSTRKPISALCKSRKELNDRMNEKISAGSSCAVMCGETSDSVDAPFIELGAVYKILDFITDSDPNVSSLTSSCCNEISRILRGLLAHSSDKTLEDLLLNDSSLYKCERCGVISYTLRSYPEDIKESEMGMRRDAGNTAAKHDYVDDNQGNEKSKISMIPAGIDNNTRSETSFVDDCKIVDRRVQRKYVSKRTRSSPIKERAFVMRNRVKGPNRTNDATVDASAKIKDKSLNNNDVRGKCLMDAKVSRKQTRYECNDATQNDRRSDKESLITAKADADKEEIVREISYEPKSKIDDLLAGIWYSENARNTQQAQRSFERHGDITAVTDTVKYLARGAFSVKEDDELLSKLQNRRCARLANASKGQGSVLYGSRNDYPHRSSGFWLFDESGHLPKILDDYRHLPTSGLDNRENARFVSNLLRRTNTTEKIKRSSSWSDCLERDSLEDCARLRQRGESDTITFSSSSAENLIQEWIGTADRNWINMDDEVPLGRQLVSSRPSLDIARHVKAEIARDSYFDNAELSMLRARDSNVVARLSSETRTKICRLIRKVLSDTAEDSTSDRENCMTIDVLNDEELLQFKSADLDEFVNFDNQTTGSECTNDRVPTKADISSEDGNHPLRRSANSANVRSQDIDTSGDSVRVPHESVITPYESARRIERADSSRRISRRIIYKDRSSRNAVNENDGYTMTEILPIYREILENSGSMEWDSFQELVEDLHPDQKEIWRTICRTISEEAKRERAGDADDNMEVCIEISPVSPEEIATASKVMTCRREIVFEVDMTLKDMKSFIGKKLDPIDERRDACREVASCSKDELQARGKSQAEVKL